MDSTINTVNKQQTKINEDEEIPKWGKVINKFILYKKNRKKMKIKENILEQLDIIEDINNYCNISTIDFTIIDNNLIEEYKELPYPKHLLYYRDEMNTINDKFKNIIINNINSIDYQEKYLKYLEDEDYDLLFKDINDYILYVDKDEKESILNDFYKTPVKNYLIDKNYKIENESSECIISKKYLDISFNKIHNEAKKVNAINMVTEYLNSIGISNYKTNVKHKQSIIDIVIVLEDKIISIDFKYFATGSSIKSKNNEPYLFRKIYQEYPILPIHKNNSIDLLSKYNMEVFPITVSLNNNIQIEDCFCNEIMFIKQLFNFLKEQKENSSYEIINEIISDDLSDVIDNKDFVCFYFEKLANLFKIKEHYIELSKSFENKLLKETQLSKEIIKEL